MDSTLEKIVVVAGIPPDSSGTGRMMRQLIAKSSSAGVPMQIVHKARPVLPLRMLLRQRRVRTFIKSLLPYLWGQLSFYLRLLALFMSGSGKLLIMHPQTLGFGLTVRLLRRWPAGKVFIYVLDSSYFCVRSYNHIAGEQDGCTRCLGGNFSSRSTYNCRPWPIANPRAGLYTETLLELASKGEIKLLSQNNTQAKLLRQHFGKQADVRVVGLWGEEWTEVFDDERPGILPLQETRPKIVFHGHNVEAKGATWFQYLAGLCPDVDFVCPFARPTGADEQPLQNMTFGNLSWESGLREEIGRAHFVAVPSLWSAPIEGALIKSLIGGQRVITMRNDTSFQRELPDDIVVRLPSDPEQAARALRQAIADNWSPDPNAMKTWIGAFRSYNESFVENVIEEIKKG